MRSATAIRLTTVFLLLIIALLPTGCSDDDPVKSTVPTVHEDLVTVWRAQSVTIDGVAADMEEFFEFSPGTAMFLITIGTDATYHIEEIDDQDQVLYNEDGTAVTSGQVLTLTKTAENGVAVNPPEVVAQGDWSVEGFTLLITIVEEGMTVVLSFNNWLS